MQAEAEGRMQDACDLFAEAWAASKDDYNACVAAHYLARHQANPEEMLRWNQQALVRANAVGDESVRSFYPSLYLNMGYSYETLGHRAEARRYYELAAESVEHLPPGRYGDQVRNGIAEGRKRVSSKNSTVPSPLKS